MRNGPDVHGCAFVAVFCETWPFAVDRYRGGENNEGGPGSVARALPNLFYDIKYAVSGVERGVDACFVEKTKLVRLFHETRTMKYILQVLSFDDSYYFTQVMLVCTRSSTAVGSSSIGALQSVHPRSIASHLVCTVRILCRAAFRMY